MSVAQSLLANEHIHLTVIDTKEYFEYIPSVHTVSYNIYRYVCSFHVVVYYIMNINRIIVCVRYNVYMYVYGFLFCFWVSFWFFFFLCVFGEWTYHPSLFFAFLRSFSFYMLTHTYILPCEYYTKRTHNTHTTVHTYIHTYILFIHTYFIYYTIRTQKITYNHT